MKPSWKAMLGIAAISAVIASSTVVRAGADNEREPNCPVTYAQLKQNLITADQQDSTGLNNHFWGVVVNRGGVVCAVAFSGPDRDAQWLLSRQIAAAKAFTANGLSLDSAPLSTGELYPTVQPGAPANPLYGLPFGNELFAAGAYAGKYSRFGTEDDPLVGLRVGGTITFGGGLGLYKGTKAIGGLGLSGDTACADHSTAWRLRILLGLVPTVGDDRITLAATAHPHCPNDTNTQGVTP